MEREAGVKGEHHEKGGDSNRSIPWNRPRGREATGTGRFRSGRELAKGCCKTQRATPCLTRVADETAWQIRWFAYLCAQISPKKCGNSIIFP
jgi:hypothetical protein